MRISNASSPGRCPHIFSLAIAGFMSAVPNAGIKPTRLVAFGLNDLLGGAAPDDGRTCQKPSPTTPPPAETVPDAMVRKWPKCGVEDARSCKCRQVTEVEQGLKELDWTYAMEVAEVGRHVARLFPKQRAAEDLQQQPPNAGIKPSHEVASA
jgi:hypothetical protein